MRLLILGTICVSIIAGQLFTDESTSRLPLQVSSNYLKTADLNNDGFIDIVARNRLNPDTLKILLNDGLGYFSLWLELPISQGGDGLIDADLDGDLDIVIIGVDDPCQMWINSGDSFIDLSDNYFPNTDLPFLLPIISSGDLDNDGDMDFISSSFGLVDYGLVPGMFENVNNSYFVTRHYPFEVQMLYFNGIADFDANGTLDIAFGYSGYSYSNPYPYGTIIMRNNLDFNFDVEYHEGPDLFFLNDIEADGDVDIVGYGVLGEYGMTMLINDGNADFTCLNEDVFPDTFGLPYELGDLDGDSIAEILTLNSDMPSIVTVLNYDGVEFGISELEWFPDSLLWNSSSNFTLFDADNDGDLDLYVAHLVQSGDRLPDRLMINNSNNGGAVSITASNIEAFTPALSDGIDSIQVFITANDALMNPIQGKPCKLLVSGTGIILRQPLRQDGSGVTTDHNGQVVGIVRSTHPGCKTIRVSIDDIYLTNQSIDVCFYSDPVPGDINADGQVDILDIVRLIGMILSTGVSPTQYEELSADMNTDGVIDILDIVLIINMILDD